MLPELSFMRDDIHLLYEEMITQNDSEDKKNSLVIFPGEEYTLLQGLKFMSFIFTGKHNNGFHKNVRSLGRCDLVRAGKN